MTRRRNHDRGERVTGRRNGGGGGDGMRIGDDRVGLLS